MTTQQHTLQNQEDIHLTELAFGDALSLAGLITALPLILTLTVAGVYMALTSTALSEETRIWLNDAGSYYFLSVPILFLISLSFLLSLRVPSR